MVTVVTGLCALFHERRVLFHEAQEDGQAHPRHDVLSAGVCLAWSGNPLPHSDRLIIQPHELEFCFAQAMTIFTALSSLPTLGRPGWDKFAWQALLWADNFKTKQTYFTIEEIND